MITFSYDCYTIKLVPLCLLQLRDWFSGVSGRTINFITNHTWYGVTHFPVRPSKHNKLLAFRTGCCLQPLEITLSQLETIWLSYLIKTIGHLP